MRHVNSLKKKHEQWSWCKTYEQFTLLRNVADTSASYLSNLTRQTKQKHNIYFWMGFPVHVRVCCYRAESKHMDIAAVSQFRDLKLIKGWWFWGGPLYILGQFSLNRSTSVLHKTSTISIHFLKSGDWWSFWPRESSSSPVGRLSWKTRFLQKGYQAC